MAVSACASARVAYPSACSAATRLPVPRRALVRRRQRHHSAQQPCARAVSECVAYIHAHIKPASAPGVQPACTAAARATRPPIECPTSSTGGAASPPARAYSDAKCCSAPTTNAVCRSSKLPARTKCVSAAGAARQRHAPRAVQAGQLLRKVRGVPVQHAPFPRRGGVVLLGCLGRERASLQRRAHAQARPPGDSPPRHVPACSCRRCRARTGRARPRGAARSARLQSVARS